MAMNKEILLPNAPYLYVIGANKSDVTDYIWSLSQSNHLKIVARFLRGKKMSTLEGVFNEVSAALQFPYYFGENWNAFEECIKDLSWLQGDAYIIVITDSMDLLSEESEEQIDALLTYLCEAGEEWSNPVDVSLAWGHPAIPFRVFFQCDTSNKPEFIMRLKSFNASFRELDIPVK
jgi:hypothetical protein